MKNCVDGQKADIHSLGVLLFILAFGVPPFVEPTASDRLYNVFLKKPKYLFKVHPSTKRAYRENKIDEDLMELISAMLANDPNIRPSSIE